MIYFSRVPLELPHLKLSGSVEFRLNGVQLDAQMLLIYLNSIATFSLNFLLD